MTHDSYINIYNNQLRSKSKLSTQFLSKKSYKLFSSIDQLIDRLRALAD